MANADWRQETGRRLKEMNEGKAFKAPVGITIIRILPAKQNAGKNDRPYDECWTHWNVGPNRVPVRCGKTIYGEGSCWLCDKAIPSLQKSKNKEHRALAESYAPRESFVVQMAYWDAEDKRWIGPKQWNVTSSLSKILLAEWHQGTPLEHPLNGFDMYLTRTGTSKNSTRYPAFTRATKASPAPAKVMAKLKPLSELIEEYSQAEQERAYYGRDEDAPPDPDAIEAGTEEEETIEELPEESAEEQVEDELLEEGGDEPLPDDAIESEGEEVAEESPEESGDETGAFDDLPELPSDDEFVPEPSAPAPRKQAPAKPAVAPKKTSAAPPRRPVTSAKPVGRPVTAISKGKPKR